MDARQQTLYEAAVEGNVISLQRLLEEDRLVLDRYAATALSESPVHISAMLGHLDFTREILVRKPEFAKEVDSHKSTPLHLATANGHLGVVELLLSVNSDMCLAQDKVGNTPLHIAVIKGRVAIMKVLLQAKPEAYNLRGKQGETILHLCVKHNQLDALKFLAKAVDNGTETLDIKDDDGFTILHRAVANREFEIIKFLITETKIQVNARNANGFTALDIALAHGRSSAEDINIQYLLRQGGGLRGTYPTSETNEAGKEKPPSAASGQPKTQLTDKKEQWIEQHRNALMVVASLIATMAFQAGVNPPGGVWQQDKKATAEDPESYLAGRSVISSREPKAVNALFLTFNTISLVSSLAVILLMISGLPTKGKSLWIQMVTMWLAMATTIVTYAISIYILFGKAGYYYIPVIASSCGVYAVLTGLILLGNFYRLVVSNFKLITRSLKRTKLAARRTRANA